MQNVTSTEVVDNTPEPDTLQVVAPPAVPNADGTMTPDSVPPTDTPAPTPAPAEEATAEQQELDALAKQADSGITPPAEEPKEGAESEITLDQKVDWLVNTVFAMTQNGATPTPSQPDPQPAEDPNAGGIADIYNGAFTNQPAETEQTEAMKQFHALSAELQQVRGALTNNTGKLAEMEQAQAATAQAERESAELSEIQNEYNLSAEDAKRTLYFFQNGQIGNGLKYARGKSGIEQATDQMRVDRAEDRDLAGRPSVSGSPAPQPGSTNVKVDEVYEQYKNATDQNTKDQLAMWLVANGGMEKIQADVQELVNNPAGVVGDLSQSGGIL